MSKAENGGKPLVGSEGTENIGTTKTTGRASNQEQEQAGHELPAQQNRLISDISRAHAELRAVTRLTAAKAAEIGDHLTTLKKQVGHGRWGKFIKEHLSFDARTAERYMRLAEHRELLLSKTDTLSDLLLTQAYTLVTVSKTTADTLAAEGEVPLPAGIAQPRPRGKAEILTGIQRGLVDGLENPEPVLLEEFEHDLLAFKDQWLSAHQRRQEKGPVTR